MDHKETLLVRDSAILFGYDGKKLGQRFEYLFTHGSGRWRVR